MRLWTRRTLRMQPKFRRMNDESKLSILRAGPWAKSHQLFWPFGRLISTFRSFWDVIYRYFYLFFITMAPVTPASCHDFVDFARTPSCWRSNTHGWLSPFRTTTWRIGEIWIQTRSCITQKYPLCNILFVAQPFGFGEFSTSEIMPRNYIMFKVSGLWRFHMRATIANAIASDVKLRWESAFDSGCRVLGVLAKPQSQEQF